MRRYGLRDDQWERIKDLLPGREGHVGYTAEDNRLFMEAVLYRYRAGIPWRDLPARFGDWKNVHRRLRRWCESGVQDADVTQAEPMLENIDPDAFLADRAYDADRLIDRLTERGITPVIPPKRNRTTQRKTDFALYRERNLVERFFNKLKQFRAIATRYDKLKSTFLAAVQFASIIILLN